MSTGLVDKRKRSREDDFSDCESTPLSKRINNLHLNNFEEVRIPFNLIEPTFGDPCYPQHNHHNPHNHHPHSGMGSHPVALDNLSIYDPELNEIENPHYFIKNKLLHELHLERLKRCSTDGLSTL